MKLTQSDIYALEKSICEESYFEFFKAAWKVIEPGQKLVAGRHIEFLCNTVQQYLEDVINNKPSVVKQLIINVPPATSKSSIFSKVLPAWLWARNPELKTINSSYTSTLSTDFSLKTRDIVSSAWYQNLWGSEYKLSSDQNTKSQIKNDKMGLRFSTSTTGTTTGFHCHVFINDDPQSPAQVLSEVERLTAINHWQKVVPSRMISGVTTLRINVQQRLHQDDVSGAELDKHGKDDPSIVYICLPAEYSENIVYPPELKDLYIDGYLDPVRLGPNQLDQFKKDLGSYQYSGQYQQIPSPEGGGIIKTEWFEYIDYNEMPNDIVWDLWIDSAYTDRASDSDPTGIMVAGWNRRTKSVIVRYAESVHKEMPDLIRHLKRSGAKWGLNSRSKIYVEPKASGITLMQYLRRKTTYNVVKIKGKILNDGKVGRIQLVAARIEGGRMIFVKGGWNQGVVEQLTMFPVARHDEYVDTCGYAANHYFRKNARKGITIR